MNKSTPNDIPYFNREEAEGPDERQRKLIVYVLGLLSELKKIGAIQGGSHELTSKGLEEFKKLNEEGFGQRVTREELEYTMMMLQRTGYDDEDTDA